uniref:Uncharacterized protein n=1 Tax=Panagrolaimus sp. ES5 TaxID=591445 RepID=A0AC34FXJ7_9BILA
MPQSLAQNFNIITLFFNVCGSERSSPDSQFSSATIEATPVFGGNRKFSDTKSYSTEERRKLSVDNSVSNILLPKKLKPSLRMKAYKGRRQETFHSLEAYVAKNDDTPDSEEVTSSISEDVLKMPAIEALRISSPSNAAFGNPSNPRKNYQKINSDPSLVTSSRKSASVTREATGSRTSSATKKSSNLVLHTIEQADGGVIGFLAESGDMPSTENTKNAKK